MRETPAPKIARADLVTELANYVIERRLFVAKVMGASILLYAVLLFLIPNKFRAEAQILIQPPRFSSEVRTEALSVATVKNLLESGELTQSVIDYTRRGKETVDQFVAKIGEEKAYDQISRLSQEELADMLKMPGEDNRTFVNYLSRLSRTELQALHEFKSKELANWTVEDLSKSLKSEDIIEKKTASDIKISPLVNLHAIAETGPKAQLLANTWAMLFEEKYNDLTTKRTRFQSQSINKNTSESQIELIRINQEIVRFKAEHNLELYQKQIDEFTEDNREFTNQAVLKESAIRNEETKLQQLSNIAASVESATGEWIGRVNPLGKLSGESTVSAEAQSPETSMTLNLSVSNLSAHKGLGSASSNEELGADYTDQYNRLRSEALISRDKLSRAREEVNAFYLVYPIETMEKELQQMQRDYLDALTKLRTEGVHAEALRQALEAVDAELSRTQPMLTLNTAVPDVTIGESLQGGQRESLKSLAKIQFQRQEVNPVWTELQQRRNRQAEQYELARNEVAELEKQIAQRRTEVTNLQQQIYQGRTDEKLIGERLAQWQRANRELFEKYVDTRTAMSNSAQQIAMLRSELHQVRQSASQTSETIQYYQSLMNESGSRLQLLEGQQRAIQRASDLLLAKSQEATIAVSEELSDVSVAAAAVTPMKHYFPQRSVFLALLTLLTFFAVIGLLARTRYLELAGQVA